MTTQAYLNVGTSVIRRRRFHDTCWRFESAMRQGQSPRIEDFLNDAGETIDSGGDDTEMGQELLAELLLIELEWRYETGSIEIPLQDQDTATKHHATTISKPGLSDRPRNLASYVERFPIHEKLIGQLWDQFQQDLKGPDLKGRLKYPEASPPESVNLQHDRYDFIEEIDRGGSGAVWRVYDRRMHREAAVKFLFDPHVGTSIRLRLQREARLCGRLQHPGIVPVYELGQFADGRPLIAMKLIQGRTLAAILSDEQASSKRHRKLDEWLTLFRHVCEAMAHAHSQGVIHRDLKPANLMVGSFDEVQVMDWGLGKDLGGASQSVDELAAGPADQPAAAGDRRLFEDDATILGSVMGTPLHMPPEQAEGEIDRVDRRSDVFSLGSILCAILTGSPAYAGASDKGAAATTRAQRLHAAKKRINKAKAPRAIRRLAIDCLQIDPDDRPADAGAVVDRLTQIETRRRRRRRTIAGTIGSVLILVTLFELVTADHVTILPAPHVVSSPDEMVISTYDQLLADGKLEAAEQLLTQAQADVSGPRVRMRLAELMRSQDRLSESEQVLRQLTIDFPRFVDAPRLLADVLRADGRPDEALEVLENALVVAPDSAALQSEKNELQSAR